MSILNTARSGKFSSDRAIAEYCDEIWNVQPVTVKVKKVGEGNDPWGKYRAGFETTFVIKRSEFDMNFMAGQVGDDVTIIFATEGIRS